MPSQPKPSKLRSTKLANCVRQLADASDRWFVGIAHNLQDIGAQAQTGASDMAASVNLAYNATLGLTQKIARSSEDPPPDGAVPLAACRADTTGDEPLEAPLENPERVAVLLATSRARDPDTLGEASASPEAGHFPGVLPILQALERVMGEHTKKSERSLERDSRFWRLIQLLHLLQPPQSGADGSNGDSGPRSV
jgi:hypothetical protein